MQVMRVLLLLTLACTAAAAQPAKQPAKPAAPVPSSHLKAYKGPEGAVIVMIEANDGKQMLVHFHNVTKDLEGKTLLWDYEDLGQGDKNVFEKYKRGSKWLTRYMLTARDNAWHFYHPTDSKMSFAITYSETESAKYKIEDIVKAYKP
jgi:hypothetical protein